MNRMNNKDTIIIYGCGGHGRAVADVALYNGYQNIIFVDENARENEKIFGFDVVNVFSEVNQNDCIVALGDNQKRAQIYNALLEKKAKVIALFSNNAYLGKDAQLNSGVFANHAAHIGTYAKIGANTLINTRCIIEHDAIIGAHCNISVNAVVAGKSRIGDFVMVGVGATIIDNIKICSNVVIGAGAVVVKNIEEPGIYVGVPARKIKKDLGIHNAS